MKSYYFLLSVLLFSFHPLKAQNFSYKKSSEGIELNENNKPVLFYQVNPKSVNGRYERSGYVHPLYDMSGNVITEDSPADHVYHRGIYWAWHQVVVNDKTVANSWTSQNIAFVPQKAKVKKSKKNLKLHAQLVWTITDSEKKPQNIINENTTITVYRAENNYRIIDFDILLKPLTDVKLGGSNDEKGYGGFCLRIINSEQIKFISGEKLVLPQETAVMAGPWMDFNLGGSGIAVIGYKSDRMDHPWILRNEKSMQNVPYPGRTPVQLPKEGLRLQYRVIIHNDRFNTADMDRLYSEYVSKK